MVKLDVVHASNSTLVKSQPLVAVFPGGTSGIGEYAVRALAAANGKDGKGLRTYIAGRNQNAAEKIIADCQTICPAGQFRFVKAKDLSLLKDVDSVSDEIMQAEEQEAKKTGGTARIDLLVMTQGVLDFGPRNETKEGLDNRMSLLYYSRIRFTLRLLPLLLASSFATGAHIISVFGPGRDDKIFPDDLSLRGPKHYNIITHGSHVAYMKTFTFEQLAAKYPGKLSMCHYYPSLVWTPAFNVPELPWWFRKVFQVLGPLIRLATVPEKECGERVVFLASGRYPARAEKGMAGESKSEKGIEVAVSSDGVVGGGAYRANWDGEPVPLRKTYPGLRADGMSQKVWDHTMTAFEEIEAGRTFKE